MFLEDKLPPEGGSGLLDGLLDREELVIETGWGKRTILRREHEGMPVIVIGADRYYPRDRTRQWILSRERNRAVRKAGRPKGGV